MTAREFVRENLGERCYVEPAEAGRRYGRVAGVSAYDTVVVEFEPYPELGNVGCSQEWPVERVTVCK